MLAQGGVLFGLLFWDLCFILQHTGGFMKATLTLACLRSRRADGLQGKEFKITLFVEPAAFEILQRQVRSAGERQSIQRQLNVRVALLVGVGLVIKDMEESIANLEKIDVPRYDFGFEIAYESTAAVIFDIVAGEIDRNFDGDSDGIVDQHETLQSFVAFLIAW